MNDKPPAALADFEAVEAYLQLAERRQRLDRRWQRQAVRVGLPSFAAIGTEPEPIIVDSASQFETLLGWWTNRWAATAAAMDAAGFDWPEFRTAHVALSPTALPFDRDAALVAGPLRDAVLARVTALDALAARGQLAIADANLARYAGQLPAVLRAALSAGDPGTYDRAWQEIARLTALQAKSLERRHLLTALAATAPSWADAIRRRVDGHETAAPPGEPDIAWRWLQLHQESTRRAHLDEMALTHEIHERRRELRKATAELIDAKAWLAQLGRTGLAARAALQGWADTIKKIGKGTGRRAPELQRQARSMLAEASAAVPVWIMPLSRVAETIDPTRTRFDVVIIDEASQSNVLGLLAWYLGDRVAVVGDHEQVSPLDVGKNLDTTKQLIEQYLLDIPNAHLYDGTTSVYHLARQCFGGTIPLREHFRCVPDIIGFSNALSYNFEIRPLRNPMTAARPHVAEYVVDPALRPFRSDKVNRAEARAIAALLKTATTLPEYQDKSFGAISLLGDEQAHLIQEEALRLVGAVELDRRRFTAGNSAQFQGDERDVIFLSMVDMPGDGPLRYSDGDSMKQRYNVAASRAKDQLWLVHSLDPGRDLKVGDLRRRLIEHIREPGAVEAAIEAAQARADSVFERDVLARLITAGYLAQPQVRIGSYRVDMVVSHGTNQIVVECDGDRYHGMDVIPKDMARQADLERVGWRFIRLRGTRFYRDPEGVTRDLFDDLARAGVHPSSSATLSPEPQQGNGLRERMIQVMWQVMREQGWVEDDRESVLAGSPNGLFSTLPEPEVRARAQARG